MQDNNIASFIQDIYSRLYQYYTDQKGFHVHWFGTRDLVKLRDISNTPVPPKPKNKKTIAFIKSKIDEKLANNSIKGDLASFEADLPSFDMSDDMFKNNKRFGDFCRLCDIIDKNHIEIVNDLFNNHLDKFESEFDIVDKFRIDIRSIIMILDNNGSELIHRHNKTIGNYGHVQGPIAVNLSAKGSTAFHLATAGSYHLTP